MNIQWPVFFESLDSNDSLWLIILVTGGFLLGMLLHTWLTIPHLKMRKNKELQLKNELEASQAAQVALREKLSLKEADGMRYRKEQEQLQVALFELQSVQKTLVLSEKTAKEQAQKVERSVPSYLETIENLQAQIAGLKLQHSSKNSTIPISAAPANLLEEILARLEQLEKTQQNGHVSTDEDQVFDEEVGQLLAIPTKDDLTQIRSINPSMARKLNQLGYASFEQLSQMDANSIYTVSEALNISIDKIKKENWIDQAQTLLEFSNSNRMA